MNIEQMEAVALAATPGPWHHRKDGRPDLNNQKDIIESEVARECEFTGETHPIMVSYGMPAGPNAAFVAAANPQAVLKLIAVAKAAQAHINSSNNDDSAGDTWADMREALAALSA